MKSIIEIYNAHSRIIAQNNIVFDLCEEILSYTMAGAHFATMHTGHGWDGKIKLMNKKGEFPTGLLPKLVTELKRKGLKYELKDARKKPAKKHELALKGFPPRPYQAACAEMSDQRTRGVFVMGTGAGKTYTAALIVQRRGVDTLIVTPDTGLREQLTKDFRQWFGKAMVGNKVTDKAPIIVANIQSLAKLDAKAFLRFECLVIDEFHHSGAKTYKKINKNCINAFYRYGFTGTFTRSSGDTMEMFGVLSNVIFKITTSELIRMGYLVKPYIDMIDYELPKMRCRYQEAYNYLIQDAQLHELIARIANKKVKEKKQTLIVVRRKEHGKEIADLIHGAVYLDGDSESKYREEMKQAFIDKKIGCIVATNIFGEGIDIPTIDVYMNARFEKTQIWTAQGIGRALRKAAGKDKAEVFDFYITGHAALKTHSNERVASYEREEEFVLIRKKAKDYDHF